MGGCSCLATRSIKSSEHWSTIRRSPYPHWSNCSGIRIPAGVAQQRWCWGDCAMCLEGRCPIYCVCCAPRTRAPKWRQSPPLNGCRRTLASEPSRPSYGCSCLDRNSSRALRWAERTFLGPLPLAFWAHTAAFAACLPCVKRHRLQGMPSTITFGLPSRNHRDASIERTG